MSESDRRHWQPTAGVLSMVDGTHGIVPLMRIFALLALVMALGLSWASIPAAANASHCAAVAAETSPANSHVHSDMKHAAIAGMAGHAHHKGAKADTLSCLALCLSHCALALPPVLAPLDAARSETMANYNLPRLVGQPTPPLLDPPRS